MKTKKIILIIFLNIIFGIKFVGAYGEVHTNLENIPEEFKKLDIEVQKDLIKQNIETYDILKKYGNISIDDKGYYVVSNYSYSLFQAHSIILQRVLGIGWIVIKDGKIVDIIKDKSYFDDYRQEYNIGYTPSISAGISSYGNHYFYRFSGYEADPILDKVLFKDYGYYIDGQKVANFDMNDQYGFQKRELNFLGSYDSKKYFKKNYLLSEEKRKSIDNILKYVKPEKYDDILNLISTKKENLLNNDNKSLTDCKKIELYSYIYTELKIMQLKINYINNPEIK